MGASHTRECCWLSLNGPAKAQPSHWCSRGTSDQGCAFQGSLFEQAAKSICSFCNFCSRGIQILPRLKWICLDRSPREERIHQISAFHRGKAKVWKLDGSCMWGQWPCNILEDKPLVFLLWMTHCSAGFAVPPTFIEVEEDFKLQNFSAESRSRYLVPWRLRPCNTVVCGVGSSPAMGMSWNSPKASRIETQGLKLSKFLCVFLHLGWREEKQKLFGQMHREMRS